MNSNCSYPHVFMWHLIIVQQDNEAYVYYYFNTDSLRGCLVAL